MSVNIQTANGLVRVSGTNDYNELLNTPNITDDGSDNLVVADKNGNKIFQVDASGATTTGVFADKAVIGGEDVIAKIEEHASDTDLHITSAERTKWNNKSEFSGDYNDLANAPDIVEDESGALTIQDTSGNAILKVDKTGLATTDIDANTVNADEVNVGGENIATKIDEHVADTVKHITSTERTAWNNKSDFSGNYTDLEGRPNIDTDDTETELRIMDGSGNSLAVFDQTGLTTTVVTATQSVDTPQIVVAGEDLGAKVSDHVGNSTIHVTSADKTKWNGYEATINALPTKDYVEEAVESGIAEVVGQAPETLNALDELAAALGDDPNFATTVAAQIGQKADKTELHEHSNKSVLDGITADRVANWDTVDYSEIENKPNIESDDTETELRIMDNSGNSIALVDKDGVHTTNVYATQNILIGTENAIDLVETLNAYILNIDYDNDLVAINTAQVLG